MSFLLSLDPGVTCPGAALFDIQSKKLVAARRWKGHGFKMNLANVSGLAHDIASWAARICAVYEFASEWQVLRGRKDVKAIQSQAPLWALVGGVGALLNVPTKLYPPHEWKGNKNPNPTARMIIGRLTPEERERFEDFGAFSLKLTEAELESIRLNRRVDVNHPAENTSDAVGVGLKHLGRLEIQRVIQR